MWKFENKIINSIDDMPENTIGFVYEIKHIPSGQIYIGKKQLFSERNVKIGKRELAQIKEERKRLGMRGRVPAKKKVIKEMDWQNYYGSSPTMKELVKSGSADEFDRNIIRFVDSKKKLTYYEEKELYTRSVLESDNEYINDNIAGRFFRRDLIIG